MKKIGWLDTYTQGNKKCLEVTIWTTRMGGLNYHTADIQETVHMKTAGSSLLLGLYSGSFF
jgi:hypothetical protein